MQKGLEEGIYTRTTLPLQGTHPNTDTFVFPATALVPRKKDWVPDTHLGLNIP